MRHSFENLIGSAVPLHGASNVNDVAVDTEVAFGNPTTVEKLTAMFPDVTMKPNSTYSMLGQLVSVVHEGMSKQLQLYHELARSLRVAQNETEDRISRLPVVMRNLINAARNRLQSSTWLTLRGPWITFSGSKTLPIKSCGRLDSPARVLDGAFTVP